ncbi:unnamed protein product [Coregonus sp. 'balchen']|nr:unnamed protein product [Coregonus sp. 'balchen']
MVTYPCIQEHLEDVTEVEQSELMEEIKSLGAEHKVTRGTGEGPIRGELCLLPVSSWPIRGKIRGQRHDRTESVCRLRGGTMSWVCLRSGERRVGEVKSRLAGLEREKTDANLLRTQIEENFNLLQAELKAKVVDLKELSSEYISLKRDQGSREEWDDILTSLRVRYDDIRSKYNVLLRKKSQMDLDIAPLKTKLSFLVVKCQQRNSLLVQMMRTPTFSHRTNRVLQYLSCSLHSTWFVSGHGRLLPLSEHAPHFTANGESVQVTGVPDRRGLYQAEVKGEYTLVPACFLKENGRPLIVTPPCASLSRKLTSPEKIINLHQQLQKTNSYLLLPSKTRPQVYSSPPPGQGNSPGYPNPNLAAPNRPKHTPIQLPLLLQLLLPVVTVKALSTTASLNTAQTKTAPPTITPKTTAPTKAAPSTSALPPKPPAEVGSVEVIRMVGQSSLMIGWEPLYLCRRGIPQVCNELCMPQVCGHLQLQSSEGHSPNLHPSRELTLREGDTVTLLGNPRNDGFCDAEVNGRRGLAPVAFVEEVLVPDRHVSPAPSQFPPERGTDDRPL